MRSWDMELNAHQTQTQNLHMHAQVTFQTSLQKQAFRSLIRVTSFALSSVIRELELIAMHCIA